MLDQTERRLKLLNMLNSEFLAKSALLFAIVTASFQLTGAQTPADGSTAPKPLPVTQRVTQIDLEGLKKILKPNGRPLLINFWATWCPPCTEEFPDLVKLDAEYRGKVDFVTVSFDDLADINTYVPKFLDEMRSEMPAYLLHTPNEDAAIAIVSRDWAGNLPMTVLYDATGKQVYSRMGKLRVDPLRENIRKLLPAEQPK
jgi:thiol-disulfide isomerase/thioredoxin